MTGENDDTKGGGPFSLADQAAATTREASNLVRAEDASIIAWFVALAERTTRWLPRRQSLSWFLMDTSSAFSGLLQMSMWRDVPPDLAADWTRWRGDYAALLARNPRLELARMMSWISEDVDSSSWPDGYEDALRVWVDRGERLPLPPPLGPWAEDGIDEAFYRRMVELQSATGGWIHLDRETGRRVFVHD